MKKTILAFACTFLSTLQVFAYADPSGARDYGLNDDDFAPMSPVTILIISIIALLVGVFLGRLGHDLSKNGEDNTEYVMGILLALAGFGGIIFALAQF